MWALQEGILACCAINNFHRHSAFVVFPGFNLYPVQAYNSSEFDWFVSLAELDLCVYDKSIR